MRDVRLEYLTRDESFAGVVIARPTDAKALWLACGLSGAALREARIVRMRMQRGVPCPDPMPEMRRVRAGGNKSMNPNRRAMTDAQVASALDSVEAGFMTIAGVAARYGCAIKTARESLRRERARRGMAPRAMPGGRPTALSPEKEAEVFERRKRGEIVASIARVMGIASTTVRRATDRVRERARRAAGK